MPDSDSIFYVVAPKYYTYYERRSSRIIQIPKKTTGQKTVSDDTSRLPVRTQPSRETLELPHQARWFATAVAQTCAAVIATHTGCHN